MSGQLIYGIVCTDETRALFLAILSKRSKEEIEQGYTFEESHGDLQLLYDIYLINEKVDPFCQMHLYAFRMSASDGFEAVPGVYPASLAEYDRRITAFLTALGIETTHKPRWFLR